MESEAEEEMEEVDIQSDHNKNIQSMSRVKRIWTDISTKAVNMTVILFQAEVSIKLKQLPALLLLLPNKMEMEIDLSK